MNGSDKDRHPPSEAPAVSEREEHRHIDPKLLELLVCPLTKTTLHYDPSRQELISRAARLAFPIRDGVPVMIEGEARRLDEERK